MRWQRVLRNASASGGGDVAPCANLTNGRPIYKEHIRTLPVERYSRLLCIWLSASRNAGTKALLSRAAFLSLVSTLSSLSIAGDAHLSIASQHARRGRWKRGESAGNFPAFSYVITLGGTIMTEHNAPTRTPLNPLRERILRWISGSGRGQAFGHLPSLVDRAPSAQAPLRKLDPLDSACATNL
jgi:hypothetical protein